MRREVMRESLMYGLHARASCLNSFHSIAEKGTLRRVSILINTSLYAYGLKAFRIASSLAIGRKCAEIERWVPDTDLVDLDATG